MLIDPARSISARPRSFASVPRRNHRARVLAALAALSLLGATSSENGPYGARRVSDEAAAKNSVILWADARRTFRWDGRNLRGMPVLIKDNIETRDMPTTAGSLALLRNAPGRDAPLVARLRRAGVVILGKTNLTEWANFRSSTAIPGWSAVSGQTVNAFDSARTPCGSSAGSAVAVALGLAPAAIGTETDGSITCPASVNGVVGFKPTVGLISRTHVIPISHSQDTPGPITRTVRQAAWLLTAMAGRDPADPATSEADRHKADYDAGLNRRALRSARIGVMRFLLPSYSKETCALFEQALQRMRSAGAELIDIPRPPADFDKLGGWEFEVLATEFKHDLNAYLASTRPDQVGPRTLAELIAYNLAEPREMPFFKQETFEVAEKTKGIDDPSYLNALANARRAAGADGIDRMLSDYRVSVLVAPSTSRAATLDRNDDDKMHGSAAQLPAVAGYPHLTVPMDRDRGLPVGISFIGTKWSDGRILSLGYAFEQLSRRSSYVRRR